MYGSLVSTDLYLVRGMYDTPASKNLYLVWGVYALLPVEISI